MHACSRRIGCRITRTDAGQTKTRGNPQFLSESNPSTVECPSLPPPSTCTSLSLPIRPSFYPPLRVIGLVLVSGKETKEIAEEARQTARQSIAYFNTCAPSNLCHSNHPFVISTTPYIPKFDCGEIGSCPRTNAHSPHQKKGTKTKVGPIPHSTSRRTQGK